VGSKPSVERARLAAHDVQRAAAAFEQVAHVGFVRGTVEEATIEDAGAASHRQVYAFLSEAHLAAGLAAGELQGGESGLIANVVRDLLIQRDMVPASAGEVVVPVAMAVWGPMVEARKKGDVCMVPDQWGEYVRHDVVRARLCGQPARGVKPGIDTDAYQALRSSQCGVGAEGLEHR
jgi:hypothetical protein